MAVNKVMYFGETLLDLTADTVTPADVMQGKTLHTADGQPKTGSFTLASELATQDSLIEQIKEELQGKSSGGTAAKLQSKTVELNANGQHVVTPDTGYDGMKDVTVNVNVASSGKNMQGYRGYASVTSTSYTATAVKLTVKKTGTYNVSWMGWRSTNSGTSGSQLYKNGTAYGSANTSFVNTYGHSVNLSNVPLNEGDEIVVRARARSTSYVMAVGNLIIEEV